MAISLSSLGQYALPQANINSDITPQLAALTETINKGQRQQTLAQLGQGLADGTINYQQAAGKLAAAGDLAGSISLLQLGQKQHENAAAANAITQAYGGGSSSGAASPSAPVAPGPTVPNDSNALPGQVGMDLRLADRSQDFIQDNPGTYLSSGYRSPADQARLYADRANNPNPVAPPGSSNHERGMAVDIGGMTPDQRGLLSQYGLAQPVANDPPHVELAPGQSQQPVQVASNAPMVPTGLGGAQPITSQQFAALAANPSTRPVAMAMLQSRLSGKQVQFLQVNGKIVAADPRTGQVADVTPAGMGSGYRPATAQEKSAYGVGDDSALLIGPDGKPQILNEGKADYTGQVKQRQAAAAGLGLAPGSPAYQSFVLTGKMPREDAQPLTATDKKAILEADEKVQATQQVIDNLGKAKALSRQALSGPAAAQRGYLQSFLPESMGGETGVATTDMNNLVTTNALTQLKTIFGGNPTEGERHILLDVQGSASQPDAVRQKIFDRAITMANRRLAFEKQRADALRGGTFYKSGQAPAPQQQQQQQGISQAEYQSLPSGSLFTAPDGTQRVKP